MKLLSMFSLKKATALLLSFLMCVQGAVIKPASLHEGVQAAAGAQSDTVADTVGIDWTYWHDKVRKEGPVVPPIPVIVKRGLLQVLSTTMVPGSSGQFVFRTLIGIPSLRSGKTASSCRTVAPMYDSSRISR